MLDKKILGTVIKVNKTNGTYELVTSNPNTIRCKSGNVLCKGNIILAKDFVTAEITGDYENDIFIVKDLKYAWINKKSTAVMIKNNLQEIRVSESNVNKIIEEYGRTLFSMKREELKSFLNEDFSKLNSEQINGIVNVFHPKPEAFLRLCEYFENYKIDPAELENIYNDFGAGLLKSIQQNPYKIFRKYDMPFYIAEKIAYRENIEALSKIRIKGLIFRVLDVAASGGNTYVTPYQMVEKVNKISMSYPYYTEIPSILISYFLSQERKIVQDNREISLKKLYYAEKNIAKRLYILKNSNIKISVSQSDINEVERNLNIKYGNDQKNAFGLLNDEGVVILTGGPGTGKSTFMKGVINILQKYFPDIKINLCAPTGRAAKRLMESTGMTATTIHKMLEMKLYETEDEKLLSKNENNPIEADFIIVDEFSMVDAELMSTLVSAIKKGTKLLLVGDENQLPSIGAGNILHDMIVSQKFPVYKLSENFRQANGGSIYENGTRILAGELPYKADDFEIYKSTDEKDSYKALCYFLKQYYDEKDIFKTQLLEPSHKGTAGVFRMNLFAHKYITHKGIDVSNSPLKNDKVIFTKTDYDSGYVNGDVGKIIELTQHQIRINLDGAIITVERSAMQDLSLAYSYTIHKSQGSEYPVVIIYLPDGMSHMMSRSLLYTAVTRAKNKVIILYEENALQKCIDNVDDIKRQTKLQSFLL